MARNPDVFGEDVATLAWEAVGIGLSGAVNDKMVSPLVQRVIPVGGSDVVMKLVDGGTTAVSGWALGEVASVVDRSVGRRLRRGGVLLGVAKVISAIIPGFSLSATVPGFFQFPSLLPAANGNGNKQLAAPKQTVVSPVPLVTASDSF